MVAKRIAALIAAPLAVFACSAGLFLVFQRAPQKAGPALPAYTLGEDGGKLALFRAGDPAPVARYDVYTTLLPPGDADALRAGIPVEDHAALRRYLEDFGD